MWTLIFFTNKVYFKVNKKQNPKEKEGGVGMEEIEEQKKKYILTIEISNLEVYQKFCEIIGADAKENISERMDKDEIEKRIKIKYNHKLCRYRNIAFLNVLNFVLFLSITSLYGDKIDTRLVCSIFFILSFWFFMLLDSKCPD